ncbi:MAG TPA: ATP-binding protein, partial [Candidatus Acidoferrum sp.]|nr:ATP-binding protein [Candidatus Acidoferrum sp.]
KLVLEVADYGRGFPTWLIEGNLSTGAGVGIASMRAQANQYHGALAIQSNESGTTLRVVFPSVYLTRAAEIALS